MTGRSTNGLSIGPLLVIGPGAIGTIVAARLAAAGQDVTVACRTQATADLISQHGLTAEGFDGETVGSKVRAITRPQDLAKPPHLAILATKCADAAQALRTWVPHLAFTSPVIAMQNGLIADELSPLSEGRLVECVVAFAATLTAPGHSVQTSPGGFILGEWPSAKPTARVELAARALRDVGPVETSANMRGHKWTKLLINSAITTLGVATNRTLGDLLQERRARAAFLAVATEGYRAGLAEGVHFEPVSGFRPDRLALPKGKSPLAHDWRHLALRLIGRRYRRHKSSSLQSLERGQKTEVHYLNAAIVAAASRHRLAAPVNQALVHLVTEIEEGHRAASPENLAQVPLE